MNRGRQRGLALVLVLWVLVLMTIMAASFTLTMSRETAVAANIRDNAKAVAYAEAGVVFAQLMLLNPDETNRWYADGGVYEVNLSNSVIRVRLFDESGKVDINSADAPALRGIFSVAGLEQEGVETVVDSILDWRDEDDDVRIYGAEKERYENAGLSYRPRNRPFQSLQELQLVLGVTSDLYDKIEPLITIYSGRQMVNPIQASQEVLMSLPEFDDELVIDYVSQRVESRRNNEPPPPFPYGNAQQGGVGSSEVYTVVSEAMLPNGSTGGVRVVIKKSGAEKGLPFKIMDWKQGGASEDSLFVEYMNQFLIN